MLKVFRIVFIAIFITVLILFTIGYAALPIINASSNIIVLKNTITSALKFYIDRYTNSLDSSTVKYSSLGGTVASFLQTLLYICISTTLSITFGIICSLLGLKFISKLFFGIASLLMTTILISLIVIKSTNIISNSVFNIDINNINYDTGFNIMTIASCIMIVTTFIYKFIG